MVSTECPDLKELSGLLDSSLSEPDSRRVERHLDNCQKCQANLEQLAGGSDWIPKNTSGTISTDIGTQPTGEYSQPTASQAQNTNTGPAIDGNEFPFLDPPEKPREIGRLKRYAILECIGRGGMGIVFRAYDTLMQRTVAIKVMHPGLAVSKSARLRFLREARSAAVITHDHVVTVHSVEQSRQIPFIVMQFVPGTSLEQLLRVQGKLSVERVLHIGRQVAEALSAAHRHGIVHRDIKPANILLENHIERVLITDFGLAKSLKTTGLTQQGMIVGTPEYMAPEQCTGSQVDHRTDLFSLGCVLYQCITGKRPFEGDNIASMISAICFQSHTPIREIEPDVPRCLGKLINQLLEKDPSKRMESAASVAEQLNQLSAENRSSEQESDIVPILVDGDNVVGRTSSGVIKFFLMPVVIATVIGFAIVVSVDRLPWNTADGVVQLDRDLGSVSPNADEPAGANEPGKKQEPKDFENRSTSPSDEVSEHFPSGQSEVEHSESDATNQSDSNTVAANTSEDTDKETDDTDTQPAAETQEKTRGTTVDPTPAGSEPKQSVANVSDNFYQAPPLEDSGVQRWSMFDIPLGEKPQGWNVPSGTPAPPGAFDLLGLRLLKNQSEQPLSLQSPTIGLKGDFFIQVELFNQSSTEVKISLQTPDAISGAEVGFYTSGRPAWTVTFNGQKKSAGTVLNGPDRFRIERRGNRLLILVNEQLVIQGTGSAETVLGSFAIHLKNSEVGISRIDAGPIAEQEPSRTISFRWTAEADNWGATPDGWKTDGMAVIGELLNQNVLRGRGVQRARMQSPPLHISGKFVAEFSIVPQATSTMWLTLCGRNSSRDFNLELSNEGNPYGNIWKARRGDWSTQPINQKTDLAKIRLEREQGIMRLYLNGREWHAFEVDPNEEFRDLTFDFKNQNWAISSVLVEPLVE